jgi:hypothetical protein
VISQTLSPRPVIHQQKCIISPIIHSPTKRCSGLSSHTGSGSLYNMCSTPLLFCMFLQKPVTSTDDYLIPSLSTSSIFERYLQYKPHRSSERTFEHNKPEGN